MKYIILNWYCKRYQFIFSIFSFLEGRIKMFESLTERSESSYSLIGHLTEALYAKEKGRFSHLLEWEDELGDTLRGFSILSEKSWKGRTKYKVRYKRVDLVKPDKLGVAFFKNTTVTSTIKADINRDACFNFIKVEVEIKGYTKRKPKVTFEFVTSTDKNDYSSKTVSPDEIKQRIKDTLKHAYDKLSKHTEDFSTLSSEKIKLILSEPI